MRDVDTKAGPGRELRILFVSREYPPETGGGGIGSYVETMAQALVARGHEVHVLSCVPGQTSQDTKRDGVHLHRRGVRRWLPKIRRRLPGTAFRLEGAFSSYLELRRLHLDIDVVEAPDWMAEGLAVALRGAHPLVAHLHTPLLIVGRENPTSYEWSRDGRLAASVERFAVRKADLATSPSHLLAEDLAREGWLDHLDLRVIRYPIDVRMWSATPSPKAARQRVLAVGRLEARKAPEVLVRAAALLSPELPELEVIFVGRSSLRNGGSYKDWVANLARELSVTCRFVEEVPRNELPEWYTSSRVVAIPSRYDNFPYSGLEGMAAGRPLVCTEATGTAELLAGSAAGQVVPTNDPHAFARALRSYLQDPAHAVRAGLEARSLVERHCSPDRIAEEREACYRDVIRRWRGKPRGGSRRAGNARLSPR
jgi:glycosyltransferase involved in cell wall biosynthesis